MQSIARELREDILMRRGGIAAALGSGASGSELCAGLTRLTDDAVRKAFLALQPDRVSGAGDLLAVLALGGYGRTELCPASDVDIMLLTDEGGKMDEVGEFAGRFLHLLWDAGLELGHSVRTVEEALALRGVAPDVWASILEGRFVCGNRGPADRLRSAVSGAAAERPFLEHLLSETAARHRRYGNSVKLLEPNIKKSAGGLRDLHALFWLERVADPGFSPPEDGSLPALFPLLRRLLERGFLDHPDFAAAEAALDFLLRTRHRMHLLRGGLHDALEYSLQREVAADSGYGAARDEVSAAVFMRAYYRHTRVLYRLHVRAMTDLRERLHPPVQAHHEGEMRGSLFALHADRLTVDPALERFDEAEQVLEAFAHAAESGVEPDPRLARRAEQGVRLFTAAARGSPEPALQFRRILRSEHVGSTLRAMNDLGILGAYIPEFGELGAFSQHSLYHYYTADEHTLIAVENAERLAGQEGLLGDVYRGLPRREILHLAILLHDVGKARGIEGHEITGAAMAGDVLRRLGMEEDAAAVEFLVRHHLLMEQTAFRRNIDDPAAVREFVQRFSSADLLDLLYLLTYADLSAVNTGVWTDWKASLLGDLYVRASARLRGADREGDQDLRMRGLMERLSRSHPRRDVEAHLAGIPGQVYVKLFAEEEIGVHIAAAKRADPVSTFIIEREGFSEVTVIARDAPFLLARCCAVLAANDADIFDAAVVTRIDGVVFDRFRVTGAVNGRSLDPAVGVKIAAEMRDVLSGMLDVAHLFRAHRRRWKRRSRKAGSPGVAEVRFEEVGEFTIVDVYAADSLGLLYRLTDALSRRGLDIHFARIATRGDGVADAFYVRDRDGLPVRDPEEQEGIRTELLAVLAAAAREELA